MFHICTGVSGETPASAAADGLQFLRDLLELIALDHVAHLIFVEISQLDSAFEAGTDFFHVILETPQRRNPAIVNRLASPKNASPPCTRNPTIGHEAASDNASAQLEDRKSTRLNSSH